MNASTEKNKETQTHLYLSYALTVPGIFGVGGLHRFYNGKMWTGLLWLMTGGLFGVGQCVDLFLMPCLVAERERLKLTGSLGKILNGGSEVVERTYESLNPNSQQKLMTQLLKIAEKNGGKVTVTKAVLESGKTFNEVEETLKTMLASGYATIDNDPVTGVVTYYFHELV